MRRPKNMRIAAAFVAAAMALLTVPAIGATGAGTLTIAVPDAFMRESIPVRWSYFPGTVVKGTSLIDVQFSSDTANWQTLTARVPIRDGSYAWNVAGLADGIYAVRLRITGTSTYSGLDYAYVDNTAPTVAITRPSGSEVLLDDSPVANVDAVVAGNTTLQAYAADALSGVDNVLWHLDGEEIASGASASFDFSLTPGRHELSATATDSAGNSSSHAITILALPGQSAADVPEQELPNPEVPAVPSPDPSESPTLPTVGIPTLPPLPTPDPSSLPTPDPSSTPSPSPSPLTLPTLPAI